MVRRSLSLLFLMLAACGGNKNPCEGVTALCVSARVTGDISRLDQLVFMIVGLPATRRATPETPEAFDLPVQVALIPSAVPDQPFSIQVDGLLDGNLIERGGDTLTPPLEDKGQFEIYLNALVGDGGVGDGGVDGDGCMPTTCGASDVGMIPDGCGAMIDCGPAQLTAVTPSFANLGDTIMLEGRFGATAVVNFPGAPNVTPDAIGGNRIRVTVPANATAGALTVTTSAGDTNGLAFRAVSYGLAPTLFSSYYQQGYAARWMATLPDTVARHALVRVGRYVFSLAGNNTAGANRTVARALINADDTLGNWRVDGGSQLSGLRRQPVVVAIGPRIYVIGGAAADDATLLNSIETATVSLSNGHLSAFADAGVTLKRPRTGATAQIVGPYLYVLGGDLADGTIERSRIGADGSLGAFEDVPVMLDSRRVGAVSAVLGNRLYVFGGIVGLSQTNTILSSTISPDGTLGPFTVDSTTLVAAGRANAMIAVVGSRVCLIGGQNANAVATSECATVDAQGSVGAFALSSQLRKARTRAAGILVGPNFYVAGGQDGANEYADVEYMSFASNPRMTSPTAYAEDTRSERSNYGMAVVGDSIYLIGGETGATGATASASIDRTQVRPDGSLTPFEALATPLTSARDNPAVLLTGAEVYVIGGRVSGASTNTIEHATVNDDGSLSSFTALTTVSAAAPRHSAAAVVVDNRAWLIGGFDSAALASTESTTINSDGTISVTFASAAPVLTAARTNHRAFVSVSAVYVVGGGDAQVERSSVQVGGNGALANFIDQTVPDTQLSGPITLPAVAAMGNTFFVIGGFGMSATTNVIESAALQGIATGVISDFSPLTETLPTGGAGTFHALVVGNRLFTFGGFANITRVKTVLSAALR